ncbi:nucleotide-binding protein [Desulfolithobacter sp.]
MLITVASGKGGTGKTTVAASLATVWDDPLLAVDLDVEEQSPHLFLRPELDEPIKAWMEVPELDERKCTLCGDCAELCQFKAISIMVSTLTLYPDMCHGCVGCIALCQQDALHAGRRELGEILWGQAEKIDFLMGVLRINEAMSPPFMEQIKKQMRASVRERKRDVIIDAPPGVSCPTICSVIDSDVIVLVTDATPFGFHDFKLAWESFSPLGKTMGVVVNRAGLGTRDIYDFCQKKNIPVLAEIPFDRAIAQAYARGQVIAGVSKELGKIFSSLREKIHNMAGKLPEEEAHA